MSAPRDFVQFSVDLRLAEMRAYIMQAFKPEVIDELLQSEFERATSRFPGWVRDEMEKALREAVQGAVQRSVNQWMLYDKLEEKLRPILLRAMADTVEQAARVQESLAYKGKGE